MNTGKFVWYELLTDDCEAAETFYSSVLGWNCKDAGMPGHAYTLLSAGETMVGGLMAIPEEAAAQNIKPCWTGYIGVDDVDLFAVQVQTAGGKILRAAEDIPGVGRFAVVADLHGGVFMLFKSADEQTPEPPPPFTPGLVGWHELRAGDGESAFAFYAGLFGWRKVEAMDMGPLGVYQTFTTGDSGGAAIGGIMTMSADTLVPYWLFYFNTAAIDAAITSVLDAGGQVLHGPMLVPSGRWVAHCLDPQSAMFALVAPQR
jgi:predicted enzyme related to lactoylglutathione lyase